MANAGKVISSSVPSTSASAALSGPGHIDSERKGEPHQQHDPKRDDTGLCGWFFGQVHAGWFMCTSFRRSPGANIDCLFLQAQGNGEAAISLFLDLR